MCFFPALVFPKNREIPGNSREVIFGNSQTSTTLHTSDISQTELVPKLGQVVNNAKRNVNASLQVFCGVEQGAQPLFFEWFKNGQAIKPGPGAKWQIETSKRFSTLDIVRINKEDAGNYSCLVKNIYGSDTINVFLTVKGSSPFKLNSFYCLSTISIYGAIVSVNSMNILDIQSAIIIIIVPTSEANWPSIFIRLFFNNRNSVTIW